MSHYYELSKLESEGKKETAEYQRKIEELKSTIGMEQIIYERVGTSYEKVQAIIEHLKSSYPNLNENGILESIISSSDELIIQRRIVYKLSNCLSIKKEIKSIIEKEADDDSISDEQKENLLYFGNLLADGLPKTVDAITALNQDIQDCVMVILNKYIQSNLLSYKHIRPYLIDYKCRLSFFNSAIEQEMLNHNFEVSTPVYLSFPLEGNLKNRSLFIESARRAKVNLIAKSEITQMLASYDNFSLLNPKIWSEVVFRTCILRASFMLMNPDELAIANNAFHEIIDEEEYQKLQLDNSCLEEAIVSAFRQSRHDKSLVALVDLKPKTKQYQ